jgi:steroid delta-isomerase-like uncharacterized protein
MEELKAIARRWIEEGWQQGDAAMVDELHAPHFVDHDSAGRTTDREGFKEGIIRLYTAFPDFYAVIEDLVIDTATKKVAVRWVANGTHQGTFMGIPPTGKRRLWYQRLLSGCCFSLSWWGCGSSNPIGRHSYACWGLPLSLPGLF